MGVNVFSWALFLLSIIGISKATNAGLQDYVQCANKLLSLTRDNPCPQVKETISCIGAIIDAEGLRQQCYDTEAYPYCSMLSNSRQAPMVGSSYSNDDYCEMYQKVKYCYESECGPSGKKFVKEGPMEENWRAEPCPIEATQECIDPVAKITDVTEDSCIAVSQAKSCYMERLNSCSGSSEQIRAVTMIMVGLTDHIAQCVEKEYGFSKDGDMCVPNPIDAYVMPKMKRLEGQTKENGVNQENCKAIESVGTKLEDFIKACSNTSTDHTMYNVRDTLSKFNEPRLVCMKAGFNLPEKKGPGNGGFKGQANRDVMTFFAIVSVVAIFKMRF